MKKSLKEEISKIKYILTRIYKGQKNDRFALQFIKEFNREIDEIERGGKKW